VDSRGSTQQGQDKDKKGKRAMARARQARRSGLVRQIASLYDLLSDPTFAIVVIIALAVASILGLFIIDQIPFRGEMARIRFEDRQDEPVIWILTNLVPARPFRSLAYRTLLALLSLSLLACTIKRWRGHWRQALGVSWPSENAFDSAGSLLWTTKTRLAESVAIKFLKRRLFAVHVRGPTAAESRSEVTLPATSEQTLIVSAVRFGVSRLGPVLTHLGFLLLVVGGLWMASSGSSQHVWMRPGDWLEIPGTGAHIRLEDFRIETTPQGKVSDYISTVALYADTTLIRETELEVNKPLRYKGYSIYQSSYRQDPSTVRSVDLVLDLGALGAASAVPPAAAEGENRQDGLDRDHLGQSGHSPHGRVTPRFADPATIRVPWGKRVPLPPTPYSVAIDTFFADFRIDAHGAGLASDEHRNPAVHLRFFEGDSLAGETWYFALHPEMPVGSGPDLPLRLGSYLPSASTGLEIATHPGSAWVWAGFAVMTLGTLFSFLLRHERVWLRLRRRAEGWEIAMLHHGAPKQAPEYVNAPWEAAVTPLAIRLLRHLEPEGGAPVRWPGEEEA
jgi:hypothetical protein